MKELLIIGLCLVSYIQILNANKYDNHQQKLFPEVSFTLSGHNILWPSSILKDIYESTGRYIPRNLIATRVQIVNDRAIVAMPRYKTSSPVILGIVELNSKNNTPSIRAFPNWDLQEEGNCNAIQNPFDIVLDKRNILWVLDLGILNLLEQPTKVCPPKVVGINTLTGKVVTSIDLSQLTDISSLLQFVLIDYLPDGQIFLYISDAGHRAIIVYDVISNHGHRVFLPEETRAGCRQNKDILYLALIEKPSGSSAVYFTYFGSTKLFKINTKNLRNDVVNGSIDEVGIKENKIVVLGTDKKSAIFFRRKGQPSVYKWTTESNFSPENFVLMQYNGDGTLPTHVASAYNKVMWVIESNFYNYVNHTDGECMTSRLQILMEPCGMFFGNQKVSKSKNHSHTPAKKH